MVAVTGIWLWFLCQMYLWEPLDVKPVGQKNHMVMGAYGDETHNFDFIKAMLKQKNSIPLSQAVIKEAV